MSQVYNLHQWNNALSKEIKTENGTGFTLDVPLTIEAKDSNYKIFARYIYKSENIKARVFLKSIDFFKNNKANTNFVYPIVKTKDFLKIAERTSKKLSEYQFVKIEDDNLLQRNGGGCYESTFWSDVWSSISGFFGGAWNGVRNAINAIGSFFSNWGSSYSSYSPGGFSGGYGLYEFEEILFENGESSDPYQGWIQQELFYLPTTVTNGNIYHMNEYGKAVSNLAVITQNIKNAYPNINEGEILNAIFEAHINNAYHNDIANGNIATVISEVNLEDVIYDEHLWSVLQKFTHGFFYQSEYVTNSLTNALSNTSNYRKGILLKILGFSYNMNNVFSQAQLNWLANNPEQGKQIANFTNLNNNSTSAKNFAIEAVNALVNNGEIDLDNRLIYNPIIAQDYKTKMSPAEIVIFEALSTLQKEGYLRAATQAYIYAETHFPRPVRNTKGDTFKHTFWNALSTVYIGEILTKQLTDAHENITYDSNYLNHYKETQMDLHNNAQGRQIAYGSGKLYQLVQNALDNGGLRYLNNLEFTGVFWRATNSSQLIQTNQ